MGMTFPVSIPLITTLGCQQKYGSLIRHYHNIQYVFKGSFWEMDIHFHKNSILYIKATTCKCKTNKQPEFIYLHSRNAF